MLPLGYIADYKSLAQLHLYSSFIQGNLYCLYGMPRTMLTPDYLNSNIMLLVPDIIDAICAEQYLKRKKKGVRLVILNKMCLYNIQNDY